MTNDMSDKAIPFPTSRDLRDLRDPNVPYEPVTVSPPAFVSELAARLQSGEDIPDEVPGWQTPWQTLADQDTITLLHPPEAQAVGSGPDSGPDWSQPGALQRAALAELRRIREEDAAREAARLAREEAERASRMRAFQIALQPYLEPAFLDAFDKVEWRTNEHGRPLLVFWTVPATTPTRTGPRVTWQVSECLDGGRVVPDEFWLDCNHQSETAYGAELRHVILCQLGERIERWQGPEVIQKEPISEEESRAIPLDLPY